MHDSLHISLLLLSAAVLLVALARTFRLPSMLAYLAIGIAVGPHSLGWLPASQATARLAEFGVVFLMFSIGLEFSLPRLVAMRWQVFGLGGAQMLVTVLVSMAIAASGGLSWQAGLALGSAYAMSSTAIVAKLLSEKFDLHSASGRQTMSVLLFQDLAVVPLLVLIPALAADPAQLGTTLGTALLKALAMLLLVIVVGQRVVRPWFDVVAQRKSAELSMLNVLWLTVGMAFLTEMAGLSLALGAFLAGMLISETPYRHQVESDVRPFRDVLLGLFFVTIGALLDLQVVWTRIEWVGLVLLGLVAGKGLLMFLVTLASGVERVVAFRTAAQLAQAGEFGFVLLALAADKRLFGPEVAQPSLAAMLISMLIAPLLIERAREIGMRLSRQGLRGRSAVEQIEAHAHGVRDHVIVCGYGRTGQNLVRFLSEERVPFIALDIDAQRVRQAAEAGENVVFGDADRREVLAAAGLERARAVVVTYADVPSALKVLGLVREVRPELPVVVRATDDSHLEQLRRAGATEVIPEVIEGSLMLAMQTLTLLGVPAVKALRKVRNARADRYVMLRELYRGETDRERPETPALALRNLTLDEDAAAVGRRLREFPFAELQVRLVGLRRHGVRSDNPDPDTVLAAGDMLILACEADRFPEIEKLLVFGDRLAAARRA
ncbi:MAG: cation:proton antiporter [Pseudomonadota bacterium]